MQRNFTLRNSALLLLFLACGLSAKAADTLRVLFIGNSYTAVNNLPLVFKDMAASTGHMIITDENTPGGYTFQQHSTNTTTLNKISAGTWDYVVLQEQSQYPSFPDGQVAAEVFPYARSLDSFAKAANPCAQTVFYMTWGRKNGDASNCPGWPPVCTYQGMDSLLRKRYIEMAQDNGAVIAPAGAVWRYLRTHAPGIELYSGDESHPSFAGTYAVACAFYASVLRKDPAEVTYTGSLSAADAAQIRAAAKTVVFDSLDFWRQYVNDPKAAFTNEITIDGISFTNTSLHADSYQWFFGDGTTASSENPVHAYAMDGTYEVMLVASHCQLRDTMRQNVTQTDPGGVAILPATNHIAWQQTGNMLSVQGATSFAAGTRLVLYNLSGQKITQQELGFAADRISVDIASLPKGIYVALLQERDGRQHTLKVNLR